MNADTSCNAEGTACHRLHADEEEGAVRERLQTSQLQHSSIHCYAQMLHSLKVTRQKPQAAGAPIQQEQRERDAGKE
jgi:hypothetical protein